MKRIMIIKMKVKFNKIQIYTSDEEPSEKDGESDDLNVSPKSTVSEV